MNKSYQEDFYDSDFVGNYLYNYLYKATRYEMHWHTLFLILIMLQVFKTLLRRAEAKNYTEDNFKNYSGASPKNCAENFKKTITLNARRAFYFYYLPYFISFRSAGYQCAGPYISTFSVFHFLYFFPQSSNFYWRLLRYSQSVTIEHLWVYILIVYQRRYVRK